MQQLVTIIAQYFKLQSGTQGVLKQTLITHYLMFQLHGSQQFLVLTRATVGGGGGRSFTTCEALSTLTLGYTF